jgi:hypothetical protein
MPFRLVMPAARGFVNDWRQFGRAGARYAGFVGDAQGAVAHVATGWHCGSMPTPPLILRKLFPRVMLVWLA